MDIKQVYQIANDITTEADISNINRAKEIKFFTEESEKTLLEAIEKILELDKKELFWIKK